MDALLPALTRTWPSVEALQWDKDFLPYENNILVCGAPPDGTFLLFSRGENSVLQWTKTGRKWCLLDIKNRIPKDTLLVVQMVWEYKPPGYRQKETCLHILDCERMQGQSLADLPFSERLKCIRKLCQDFNLPGVSGRDRLRPAREFPSHDLMSESAAGLRAQLSMQAVKGSKYPRLMMKQEDGYLFQPAGVFMFRITRDPWRTAMSRGAGLLYFFHRDGKAPTCFESRPEFMAGYRDHMASMAWFAWQAAAADGKELDLKGLLRAVDQILRRPVPQEYSLISK